MRNFLFMGIYRLGNHFQASKVTSRTLLDGGVVLLLGYWDGY